MLSLNDLNPLSFLLRRLGVLVCWFLCQYLRDHVTDFVCIFDRSYRLFKPGLFFISYLVYQHISFSIAALIQHRLWGSTSIISNDIP